MWANSCCLDPAQRNNKPEPVLMLCLCFVSFHLIWRNIGKFAAAKPPLIIHFGSDSAQTLHSLNGTLLVSCYSRPNSRLLLSLLPCCRMCWHSSHITLHFYQPNPAAGPNLAVMMHARAEDYWFSDCADMRCWSQTVNDRWRSCFFFFPWALLCDNASTRLLVLL